MSKKRFEHIEGRGPGAPVAPDAAAGGVPFRRHLEPLSGERDAEVEGPAEQAFEVRRTDEGAAAPVLIPLEDEGAASAPAIGRRAASGPSAFDDVPQAVAPPQPVHAARRASAAPGAGTASVVRRSRRVRRAADSYELELARNRVARARFTLLLLVGIPASIVFYVYLKHYFKH
jgi:hypothetical protein